MMIGNKPDPVCGNPRINCHQIVSSFSSNRLLTSSIALEAASFLIPYTKRYSDTNKQSRMSYCKLLPGSILTDFRDPKGSKWALWRNKQVTCMWFEIGELKIFEATDHFRFRHFFFYHSWFVQNQSDTISSEKAGRNSHRYAGCAADFRWESWYLHIAIVPSPCHTVSSDRALCGNSIRKHNARVDENMNSLLLCCDAHSSATDSQRRCLWTDTHQKIIINFLSEQRILDCAWHAWTQIGDFRCR